MTPSRGSEYFGDGRHVLAAAGDSNEARELRGTVARHFVNPRQPGLDKIGRLLYGPGVIQGKWLLWLVLISVDSERGAGRTESAANSLHRAATAGMSVSIAGRRSYTQSRGMVGDLSMNDLRVQ